MSTTIPRNIEPVGIHEIAERLGVERNTVDKWNWSGKLPEPRWLVGNRPAWNWGDIVRWARDNDRGDYLDGRG